MLLILELLFILLMAQLLLLQLLEVQLFLVLQINLLLLPKSLGQIIPVMELLMWFTKWKLLKKEMLLSLH